MKQTMKGLACLAGVLASFVMIVGGSEFVCALGVALFVISVQAGVKTYSEE